MRVVVAAVFACAVVLAGALGGCVIYLNPLCTDQIHNGDETGIDCGGSSCVACPAPPCTTR